MQESDKLKPYYLVVRNALYVKNMKQYELAYKLGIDEGNFSKYLRGTWRYKNAKKNAELMAEINEILDI